MNKQFISICACIATLIYPLLGQAEIYKHVDADGRVTYSNVKIKGAQKINIEPADTSFGTNTNAETATPASKKATPSSFPKVGADAQKSRDETRKQILLTELASETTALAEAKKAYDEGASKPEVYQKKNADGSSSTFRNVAKYEEKMKSLQAEVDVHTRNIELLQKEISNIN